MKKPTRSGRQSGFGRNQNTTRSMQTASDITVSDLVSSKEPTAETQAVPIVMAGQRGTRLKPAMRQRRKVPNRRTIADVVRDAAANPIDFHKLCRTLLARARFKFPKLRLEHESLLQQAIADALEASTLAEGRSIGAFLWIRFVSRALDLAGGEERRAELEQRHVADITEGFASGYEPSPTVRRQESDGVMEHAIDALREMRQRCKTLNGIEHIAVDLMLAGNPAADSGLYRLALRHALAKLTLRPRK